MRGDSRGEPVVVKGEEASKSFDPALFARLFELESKHYWFRARNEVIAAVMKQYEVTGGQNARVLEIGCGNGNVLSHLSRTLGEGNMGGKPLYRSA